MYIIGLTGNIATGKSSVLRMLARLGARIIDADALAHEVVKRGTPAWEQVVETFGQEILNSSGEINRTRLGAIVFRDPEALRRLEEIVHPAVTAKTLELLQQAREPVAVIEAIKLIEAGMHHWCDSLWVVTCTREQQLERLIKSRHLNEAEARLRIEAQPPAMEKVKLADVVIDNSGSLSQTWRQVKREWERITNHLKQKGKVT